jgi:hypothetical protein
MHQSVRLPVSYGGLEVDDVSLLPCGTTGERTFMLANGQPVRDEKDLC